MDKFQVHNGLPRLSLHDGTAAIWAALRASGGVLLNAAAATPAEFEAVTTTFASNFRVHQDPTRRRYNDADTMQSVTGGSDAIGLHAERAYLPGRPELLFFCCLTPPTDGGATTFCDGAAIVQALAVEDVGRWEAATIVWHTSQDARMWQRLWGTEDRADAARRIDEVLDRHGERARARHWFDGDTLHVEYRTPALDGSWISGRQAFANYLILQDQEATGPRATLDDGSPIPRDLFERTAAAADALTIDLAWTRGDIAIIDNTRCMHGRRAFAGGDRQILVRMGDAHPHLRDAVP